MIKEAWDLATVVNGNLKLMQDKLKNWKNINISIVVGQTRELLAQINGVQWLVQAG